VAAREAKEMVLVLDFGGQYNQLIARRIRELHVYSEMLPYSTPLEKILELNPKGIIFSGGPSSVYAEKAPVCDPRLYESGIPILGICYGMQLMAQALGGSVCRATAREYGQTTLTVREPADGLFEGLVTELSCWMSHSDYVDSPPPGFLTTASTRAKPR